VIIVELLRQKCDECCESKTYGSCLGYEYLNLGSLIGWASYGTESDYYLFEDEYDNN
jgi:hypothetical protein